MTFLIVAPSSQIPRLPFGTGSIISLVSLRGALLKKGDEAISVGGNKVTRLDIADLIGDGLPAPERLLSNVTDI